MSNIIKLGGGGGSLQIGEITLKDKGGDSNFLKCEGQPVSELDAPGLLGLVDIDVTTSTGSTVATQNNVTKAYYVNNTIFFLGTSSVLSRDNGVTWKALNNNNITFITFGDGIYVGVGIVNNSTIAIYTSTTGTSWTQRYNATKIYAEEILDIAYANGRFICLTKGKNSSYESSTSNRLIYNSTLNGYTSWDSVLTTYSNITDPDTDEQLDVFAKAICADNTKFYIVRNLARSSIYYFTINATTTPSLMAFSKTLSVGSYTSTKDVTTSRAAVFNGTLYVVRNATLYSTITYLRSNGETQTVAAGRDIFGTEDYYNISPRSYLVHHHNRLYFWFEHYPSSGTNYYRCFLGEFTIEGGFKLHCALSPVSSLAYSITLMHEIGLWAYLNRGTMYLYKFNYSSKLPHYYIPAYIKAK